MYFQIAITLVCMVSYVNPVHLFIWVLHLHLYLCLLILTMALFMGHFVPPKLVKVLCFFLFVSVPLSICLPLLV